MVQPYQRYILLLNITFADGDYIAEHIFWDLRLLTPRGKRFYDAIPCKIYTMSSGQPTYWSSDRNKIPAALDIAVFMNIKHNSFSLNSSLHLSSYHSPIILLLHNNPRSLKNCSSYPNKSTNWRRYISICPLIYH